MHKKLIEQEVAIRQGTKVTPIEMLGGIKCFVEKGSVRRIWSNEAEEIEIHHGRVHRPVMISASVGYRRE